MNDNKKWSKRAGVLFWWTIASLPVIWLIFTMIGNIVASNQTGTFNGVLDGQQIFTFIDTISLFVIPSLNSSFTNLFVTLGIPNSCNILTPILCWFIQTWLLHIVVDFILLLPKIAQKLIDKVCD